MDDVLTIGIRFALYANLMLLFGVPLFAIYSLEGSERLNGRVLPLRAVILWLSVSAIGLSLLSIVAMTASMADVPLLEVDSTSVRMMIAETPMGQAWKVRIGALLITLSVAIVSGQRKRPTWLGVVSLGAAAALTSLAWTGHGAAGEGTDGTRQLVADIVHLLAAGAWLGALTALGLLLLRPLENMSGEHLRVAHRALNGFAVTGAIIVALVVVSGLVNSLILVGLEHLLSITSSLYGQLLLAKLALFAIMLGLAANNRYRLTPKFELAIRDGNPHTALFLLRRSLMLETGAAFAILALVAWLGTLQPPMGM